MERKKKEGIYLNYIDVDGKLIGGSITEINLEEMLDKLLSNMSSNKKEAEQYIRKLHEEKINEKK